MNRIFEPSFSRAMVWLLADLLKISYTSFAPLRYMNAVPNGIRVNYRVRNLSKLIKNYIIPIIYLFLDRKGDAHAT